MHICVRFNKVGRCIFVCDSIRWVRCICVRFNKVGTCIFVRFNKGGYVRICVI